MTSTSFIRKRGQKPTISAEERRRLTSMSEAQTIEGASSDPENPPVGDDHLQRMVIAREVRRVREGAGLTQPQFAAHYRLGLSRLRDWEQGRFTPDFVALAFLQLIADHPDIATDVVKKVGKGHIAA